MSAAAAANSANLAQPGPNLPAVSHAQLPVEVALKYDQKIYEIPPPASSLFLQVFITFETYYSFFYLVFLFVIEFYKGYGGLLFPPNVWGLELASICVFFFLQIMRLDLGRRANRNEHANATKFFTIFSVMACFFYAYFALFTTYVLTIDIGFGCVGFFFAFCEIFISLHAFYQFHKLELA